jgi:hypothetical protein
VTRAAAIAALALLAACGAEKAPRVVHASYTAACKADTATLEAQENAAFATTNSYTSQTTRLHKVTVSGDAYAITIADARCGVIGHVVGQNVDGPLATTTR